MLGLLAGSAKRTAHTVPVEKMHCDTNIVQLAFSHCNAGHIGCFIGSAQELTVYKLVALQLQAARGLEGCHRLSMLPSLQHCFRVLSVSRRHRTENDAAFAEILHCVVRPQSIFVHEAEGSVKASLSHFSYSSIMTPGHAPTRICGKPGYQSPEATFKASFADDVWGFGSTMFEALTGRQPFQGATGE